MRRLAAPFALALVILVPSGRALAWNGKGHRVVAYIAYQKLRETPEARARVDELLKKHPDFAMLMQGAGSAQGANFGRNVFMKAAIWPDDIKRDSRFYDETDPDEVPTPILPGFTTMRMRKPWHYFDRPFTQDNSPTVDPPATNNALVQIPRLAASLGSGGPALSQRGYNLSWLIHLVGDVHQPLHCVSRFTAVHSGPEFPEGDRGGNEFKIVGALVPESTNRVRNLHSFWDGVLGTDTSHAAVTSLGNSIMAGFPEPAPLDLTASVWIGESFAHATGFVYTLGPDTGEPPPAVSAAYRTEAERIARERMALAGYRLAALIRASL